ncbi:hypothetical protein MY04_05600 [Flammeovirga sp. MY04]|uniref:hypothetical protein n=1 Tax=Flammeovirga sp. MY04 TaxID=1191459 RepID=UPI0008246353|nr:hypothetical protein [Flammeovirga sp. MY04]QJD09381.1 hypothetical protein MY04_05600 [Flammeovirga sp. MY04]
MRFIIKIIFVILVTLCYVEVQAQNCTKCDIQTLKTVEQGLESLNFDLVYSLVCTLDSSCINNVEFGEWSNELIHKVLIKDVNLLNQVLHKLGWKYIMLVTKELQNPVIEYDYQQLFKIIKMAEGPKDMLYAEQEAIIIAAKKSGITLD